MPPVLLHAESSGWFAMMVTPLLTAGFAGSLCLIAMYLFGWRAGVAAAALGMVALFAGLTGDLASHDASDAERAVLMQRVMISRDTTAATRLDAIEDAEAGNGWHLLASAGEGALVLGLAGACFLLWRRGESSLPHTVKAMERAIMWSAAAPAAPAPERHVLAVPMPAAPPERDYTLSRR